MGGFCFLINCSASPVPTEEPFKDCFLVNVFINIVVTKIKVRN